MLIKTLKARSASTTYPVITGNTLKTIPIQTENELTVIYVYICIYSYIVLTINSILSMNEDITCETISNMVPLCLEAQSITELSSFFFLPCMQNVLHDIHSPEFSHFLKADRKKGERLILTFK